MLVWSAVIIINPLSQAPGAFGPTPTSSQLVKAWMGWIYHIGSIPEPVPQIWSAASKQPLVSAGSSQDGQPTLGFVVSLIT
ncbi:hypothetical protein N7510_010145 [Penicillium lagena]|uniref:uncharacterized protein n=1 Tax=Penicillium lagena TaxID=94218 RepID=UPI0025409121|nr:uncharacterized protein N7510_010145 [Penicillium lagena]KAJ5604991.1 hypothetical protein N7510_010145 [Penicillium lagena]